ncbi:hypothetical protein K458DRAFT_305175 [Lentithecium fluviatile CBS 122367]|uniref:Uncharacterized protein n=1 Tax=Lentithecium fluviatile CBS 122367 TaxID=1168545 RepID=A0A6G1IZF5_9PLEO|nr:hypothetical protein K458DRAFT_305175 [Lentithecium fluviatile CBS 122367]
MQPLLVHFCNICSYSTPVPFSASVFSQNNSCNHCGAISAGINVQGKQEEQANMQQEELAQLFSAHMSLSQTPPQSVPQPQQQEQKQVLQPITYASQHYTHSHHIAPTHHVQQQPAKTHIDLSELESILLRNSIDPSLLFPSQVDLFQNADNDQRLRLLELWRISPPQGRQGYPGGVDYNTSRQLYDWPPTSLAQEEAMAKLRYERLEEERIQQEEIQKHQQQLDQSMDQGADHAEPYIVSGYDMLAKREYEESAQTAANHLRESTRYNQATDPVYNYTGGNGGLWEKNVGSILDMENQYGAFAHARDYDTRPAYADEEMVM